jgi:PIN domain nuclease of toxin-antitoxin system
LREIVILQHLKKVDVKMNLTQLLGALAEHNVRVLDIKVEHIEALEKLSHPIIDNKPHEDPFDRMLISQAIAEHLTLVSSDSKFPYYKDKNFSLLQN